MIHRLHFAKVVYPAWHPNDGTGPVYAFAVTTPVGFFLIDTGIGPPHPRIDELYQPTRFPLDRALESAGLDPRHLRGIVLSHLHFDHVGNVQDFPGVPVFVQAAEWDAAQEPGYTIAAFVDAPGIDYRLLAGDTELAEGIEVIATPGHTPGHQSVLVERTALVAAQAFECSEDLTQEALSRLLPARAGNVSEIHLSHDHRVWRTGEHRP